MSMHLLGFARKAGWAHKQTGRVSLKAGGVTSALLAKAVARGLPLPGRTTFSVEWVVDAADEWARRWLGSLRFWLGRFGCQYTYPAPLTLKSEVLRAG